MKKLFLLSMVVIYALMFGCGGGGSSGGTNTTHTVSYSNNGNSISGCNPPTDTGSYLPGANVRVQGYSQTCITDYVKAGYILASWELSAGGYYTPTQSFTIGTANVTLTAQWQPVKMVFATSATWNLSALSGVGTPRTDAACQSVATGQSLPGTWMAWTSDASHTPVSRFIHYTIPIVTLNGAIVALNWTVLTSGILQNMIDLDESGNSVSGAAVWTDTLQTGVAVDPSNNYDCNDWSSSTSAYSAYYGLTSQTTDIWTNFATSTCNAQYHLYCFQQ